MKKEEFKVGDIVKVSAGQSSASIILDGQTCTITKVGNAFYKRFVKVAEEKNSVECTGLWIDEIEHVEQEPKPKTTLKKSDILEMMAASYLKGCDDEYATESHMKIVTKLYNTYMKK